MPGVLHKFCIVRWLMPDPIFMKQMQESIRKPLTSFRRLSGMIFTFFIIWQWTSNSSYHLSKKKLKMNYFNMKPYFKCPVFVLYGILHVTLHVCNIKAFIIVILHWGQATACDKCWNIMSQQKFLTSFITTINEGQIEAKINLSIQSNKSVTLWVPDNLCLVHKIQRAGTACL